MKGFFSRRTDRDSQTPIHKPSSRDTYKFWNSKPELAQNLPKQPTQNGDVAAVPPVRGHESKSSRSAAKVEPKATYDPPPSAHISDRTKDRPSSNNHRISSAAYPVYYPQPVPSHPPPKPPPSRTAELAHDRHQRSTNTSAAPPQISSAQESRETQQKSSRNNQYRPDHLPMNPHEMWHPPPYASSSRPTDAVPRDHIAQQPHRSNEDKDRFHDAARRDRHRERERGRDSDQETVRAREDHQRVREGDRVRDKGRSQEKQKERDRAELERRETERIERAKEIKRQQDELLKEQEKERLRQERRELREAEKERRRQREKETVERDSKPKDRPRVLSKARHDARHTDVPSSDDNRHAPRDSRRPSVEQARGTDSETEPRRHYTPSVVVPIEPEVTKDKTDRKDHEKRKESNGWISDSYAVRKSSKQADKDPHLSDEGGNFSDSSKRRFFSRLIQRKPTSDEKKVKAARVPEPLDPKAQGGNEVVSEEPVMPVYLPSREQNVVENLTIPAELAAAESGNETDKTGGPQRARVSNRGDEIPAKLRDVAQSQPIEPPRRPPSRGPITHYSQYQVTINQPQSKQNESAMEAVPYSKRPDKTPRVAPISIEPIERMATIRPQVERDPNDLRPGPVFPMSAPPDEGESGNERAKSRALKETPADLFAQIRLGTNYRKSQAPVMSHSTSKPEPPPSVRPRIKDLPPPSAHVNPTERPPAAEPQGHRRMSIAQPAKVEVKPSIPFHVQASDPNGMPDNRIPEIVNHHEPAPPQPAGEPLHSSSKRIVPEPTELSNGMLITRPSTAAGFRESRTQPRSGAHHQSSQSADLQQRRGPSASGGPPSRVTSIYGHRPYGQEGPSTRTSVYHQNPQENAIHGDVMTRLQEKRLQQKLGLSIARSSTATGPRPDNHLQSTRNHADSQSKSLAGPVSMTTSSSQQLDSAAALSTRAEQSGAAAHQQARAQQHPPPPPTPRVTTVLPPPQYPAPMQSNARAEAPGGAPQADHSQPTRTHYQPPPTPRITAILPPLPQDHTPVALRFEPPVQVQPTPQHARPLHHPPPTPRVGTIAPPAQADVIRQSSMRAEFPTTSSATQHRLPKTVPPTPRMDSRWLDNQPPPLYQEQKTHHRREPSYPEDQPKPSQPPSDAPIVVAVLAADDQYRTRKPSEAERPRTNRLQTIPLPSSDELPNVIAVEPHSVASFPSQSMHRSMPGPPPIGYQFSRPPQNSKREPTRDTASKESPVMPTPAPTNVPPIENIVGTAPISSHAIVGNNSLMTGEKAQPAPEDANTPQREFPPPMRIHKALGAPLKEPFNQQDSATALGFSVTQNPPMELQRDSPSNQTRSKDDTRDTRKHETPREGGTERGKPPSPRQTPYSAPSADPEPTVQATPRAPPLKLSHSVHAHAAQPLESKDLNQAMHPRSGGIVDSKPSPTLMQPPYKVENVVDGLKMPPIVRPPIVPSTPMHVPREMPQISRIPIIPSTSLHVPREMPPIVRVPAVPNTPLHVPREIPPIARGPIVPNTPLHVSQKVLPVAKGPIVPSTPLQRPRDMPPIVSIPVHNEDVRGKEYLPSSVSPEIISRERFSVMAVPESVIKPMGLDIQHSNPISFWASTPRADQASQARLSTIPGPPTPRGSYNQSLQSVLNMSDTMAERRQSTMVWQAPIVESNEPAQLLGHREFEHAATASKLDAYVNVADAEHSAKQYTSPPQQSTRALDVMSRYLPTQTPKESNIDLPQQVEVIPDRNVLDFQTPLDVSETKADNKLPSNNAPLILEQAPRSRKVSFEDSAREPASTAYASASVDTRQASQYYISSTEPEVRQRKNSNSPRKTAANIQGYTHRSSKPYHQDETQEDPTSRAYQDRRTHPGQSNTRADKGRHDSDQEEAHRPIKVGSTLHGTNLDKRPENEFQNIGSPRAHTKIQHPILAELLSAPQGKTASHSREQQTPAPPTRALAPPEAQKHSPKSRTSPPERHRPMPESSARASPPKRAMEVSEKPSKELNRDSPKTRDTTSRHHHDPPAAVPAHLNNPHTVPMTPIVNSAPLTSEHPSRTGPHPRYPVEPTFSRDRRQSVIAAPPAVQISRIDYTESRNLVIHPNNNIPVEPALRAAPVNRAVYPTSNNRHHHSSSLPVNSVPSIAQESVVAERPVYSGTPAPVLPHAPSAQRESNVRNSVYDKGPSVMRREPSEETILLRTPSSLAPSLALKPTFSKQSATPSTTSQKAKKGLFSMFKRNSGQATAAPAAEANPYDIWHPISSQTPDSSPGHDKPLGRGTVTSTPYDAPVPIPLPVSVPVVPEQKSVTSRVFTPFRYLTMGSKKHHALSDISLEAQDGTPANTEIGSPDMSILSQIPIQLPPVQDAMVAAKDWVVREADKQVHAKNRLGRYKPGIVFDAKEDPPEDQKKSSRMGRPSPRQRNSSRKEREAEKSSPLHESRTVTITNDHHESRGEYHHREH